MLKPQFTARPDNPLYPAGQLMKRALERITEIVEGDARLSKESPEHSLEITMLARDAVREAEARAGLPFDTSARWLSEALGIEATHDD